MAIDYEDRQQHNALLKSHGYRWIKARGHWILKDPQGQTTTLEKAIDTITTGQDKIPTATTGTTGQDRIPTATTGTTGQDKIPTATTGITKPNEILPPTSNPAERLAVQRWAQTTLRHRPLILATVISGHGADAEIIEISLVDAHGRVAFDSLVRPTQSILPSGNSTHGITEEMLEDAPTFAELWRPLRPLLTGYEIISYDAATDLRILRQLATYHQLVIPAIISHSLMKHYAMYVGEKSSSREYKTHSLDDACTTLHLHIPAQRALAHAQATQALLLALATPSAEQQ